METKTYPPSPHRVNVRWIHQYICTENGGKTTDARIMTGKYVKNKEKRDGK